MKYFDTFKKLLKNVGDLGELIVAKGFKKLPNLVTQVIASNTRNACDKYHKHYNRKLWHYSWNLANFLVSTTLKL